MSDEHAARQATRRSAADEQGPEGDPGARRRPPRWVWIAVGAVVLVVVAVVAYLAMNRPEPEALEPEVVTLPVPTPTVEPVERPEGTAFAQALPSTVLQYALTGLADHPDLIAQGALESYVATYGDGGGAELTVVAGQWETPEEATAALEALAADAPDAEQGPVQVEGADVGTYLLVPGEGTETISWTNGTALVQVTGPTGTVMDVHTAFPL